MNKLGKNKFLTAMGVLFVVAAAAWAILVLPAGGIASVQSAKINKAVGNVNRELVALPGEQNVNVWTELSDELKTRYAVSLEEQLEQDQNLGQWFEGITDDSTFAAFMTPYDDMRVGLEKELLDKGVELGSPVEDKDDNRIETRQPGFNWIKQADIVRADTEEKLMQAKEMLQKRFNICRAIVNAVTADVEKSQARPRRLLDVTFLEKFPFLQASAGMASDSRSYLIPIDPKRYAGFTGPGSSAFVELNLPPNGEQPPEP